jgi:hypothetical protein
LPQQKKYFIVEFSSASTDFTTNMATAPKPLVSVGDFVNCGQKLCYVESITNNLGFNQYVCIDMDSGVSLLRNRHEISVPEVTFLEALDFEQTLENIQEKGKTTQETEAKAAKRFAEVSIEDLDTLALNRSSKRTREQTSWGVTIFKGETLDF